MNMHTVATIFPSRQGCLAGALEHPSHGRFRRRKKDVVRHPSSAYGGRGEKFDADRIACAAVRGERFAPSRGRAIAAKVTPAERSVGVERVAAIRRQLASVRVADACHCWRRQDGLRREGAARSVAARRSVAGVREGRRKGLAAAFLLRRAARRAAARGGARHGDRRPTEERDDEEQHRFSLMICW